MIRYAAQVGYLATTPKGKDENRAVMLGLEYPEPPDGSYLIDALNDLGWCENGEFGIKPLSWVEIKAYADATEILNHPWEFKTIHKMSAAYSTERNHNESLRIAPYDREEKQ